ncbi:MAG: cobalt-precorrin-5B (C(1))-methyltransferase [Eubacterium ramulus]
MRFGYTTGSCASAAAKAAASMLFERKELPVVELLPPKGIRLWLEVLDISRKKDCVSCAIKKDGGDDPDVTSGLLVYATVRLCSRRGQGTAAGIFTYKTDAGRLPADRIAAAGKTGNCSGGNYCRRRGWKNHTAGSGTAGGSPCH